jgi:hypothetical protein
MHVQMLCSPEAAAATLGWDGIVVQGIESAGTVVDAVVVMNEGALERRHHSDPVLDRAVLRALMELPSGIAIPLNALAPQHLLALKTEGDGLVEWTAHGVLRTYEPACDLVGILATDQHLRLVVDQVSAFSGYALRSAYGTRRQCAALRSQATQFGVGLVAVGAGDPMVIVEPQRRGIRPSVSRWRFCEVVYETWTNRLNAPAATR